MIVRWGPISLLAEVCEELGMRECLLVASPRWDNLVLPIEPVARWSEVPSVRVEEAADLARDGIVAIGGGSAIDFGKAISAATKLPLVSVPTTYGGAEWTPYFGMRDPQRRMRGGGSGARLAGIVYDVGLTVGLPREETVGTAMNALAHCAEALYVRGRSPEADVQALAGAHLIAEALPRVLADGSDRDAREDLLRGAMHGGHALGLAGLALAHAMAQALGGAYGISHGAMNALCLPPALAFNREIVPEQIERFAEAIGGDAVERTRELGLLGGFERLRDFGVPEGDLPGIAEAAAARAGNQANPRPASSDEVLALLRGIW